MTVTSETNPNSASDTPNENTADEAMDALQEANEAAHDAESDMAEDVQLDDEGAIDGIHPLEEEVLVLKADNADLKERYLRLAADMENLRRRTEREMKDARTFAVSNFARDMLTVSDDLNRALQAVKDGQQTATPEVAVAGLIEGVAATERAMIANLERHGVKRIDPMGEKFDANFHQAMFEVPDPSQPNNTIVQVAQPGFTIGDRVLRPAMVGVSKGGPKASADNK